MNAGRFSPVCVEKSLPGTFKYRRQNQMNGLPTAPTPPAFLDGTVKIKGSSD